MLRTGPASARICCNELKGQFSLLMRFALMSAPKLVYLHSLGGTGHVAPTMALCIGCVRLVTFGDPTAIVWLDVSRSGGRATARHTGNGNRHLRFEVYQGLARKGP